MMFETRQATPADADEIADVHRDAILSIGPAFYPADVVAHWHAGLTGDLHRRAMANGEVFFIAVGELDGCHRVLGFASDHTIEGSKPGVSAYVRGRAARRGIGTRLLQLAVAHARQRGGASIEIESSLAAVEFYKASGFIEVARGSTTLRTGHPIECVFMRRDLT